MRLEVRSLIGMNDVWDALMQKKLVEESAGYGDCLLVLQCVRLKVFCEVIDKCQNVSVSTLLARKRTNNVHNHAFKWRFSVDRSKCSAYERVSCVPIASRECLTPVLDVFTDLQPVKPLFEFADCLLNSEVAFTSRAVCELDDLLARCPRDHRFNGRFRSIVDSSTQT